MNAPKVIAVVDDEAAIRKAIVRLLGANGFVARDYPSAEAFLDCQMARESACPVLDINLGGIVRHRAAAAAESIRFADSRDLHHGGR